MKALNLFLVFLLISCVWTGDDYEEKDKRECKKDKKYAECIIRKAFKINREFHIRNRVKTDNKQVLINIDAITTAMRENKQFTFDYYDYDTDNNMICNGTRQCSPWEMAISSEEYYAVSYYLKYPDSPTNFRIDRMKNIQLLDESRVKPPKEIVIGDYLKSSFSMFSGVDEYVTLRFPMENKMCNVVYDKFGHDTHITKDGDKYFQICVPIKTEQPKAFFSWLALFEGEVQILKPLSLAEEFLKRIEEDKFLEHAEFVGNYYGTPKDKVEELRTQGKNVFLEIEINGATQVFKNVKDDRMISFFLMPPSINDLEARIRKRKSETEEVIKERLEKGAREMTMTENYDYIVLNDSINRASHEIIKLIKNKMKQ